jgi:hypothetical protein
MKPVFWLGCYGCIFHGTGNSAQLWQKFGIWEGVWLNPPNPPPSVCHWIHTVTGWCNVLRQQSSLIRLITEYDRSIDMQQIIKHSYNNRNIIHHISAIMSGRKEVSVWEQTVICVIKLKQKLVLLNDSILKDHNLCKNTQSSRHIIFLKLQHILNEFCT